MALYTHLSRNEIARLAFRFGLPSPRSYRGILQGTVNTFYRLQYSHGAYFLKVDEVGDRGRLRRELSILHRLAKAGKLGFATPVPLRAVSGRDFVIHRSRAILLFREISGTPILHRPFRPAEIRQIGAALARLHLASGRPSLPPHRFHLPELFRIYRQIKKKLRRTHPAVDLEIHQWLDWFRKNKPARVASGLIHADLFPENILFERGRLKGILDFEAAGWGAYLFDIATTIHACCLRRRIFGRRLAREFLRSYQRTRKPAESEKKLLGFYLYVSAIRFLLTRLRDFELKEGPVLAKPFKDYREYLNRLSEIPEWVMWIKDRRTSL